MYADANTALAGSLGPSGLVGQTVTGSSTVLSTNAIDLAGGTVNGVVTSTNRDLGQGGEELCARASVVTAFTGLTALTINIIQADDSALSTNVTVIGSSGPIPVASLTAGARFQILLQPRLGAGKLGQRYLGAQMVPSGTGTAGALYVDLGPPPADWKGAVGVAGLGFVVL